jgi:hypothetical protein
MTSYISAQNNKVEDLESAERLKNIFAINIGYLITALKNGAGFGIGGWYERYLNNYFSVVIDTGGLVYETNENIGFLEYDISTHGRFYPFGTSIEKLFLGSSFGYSFVQISYNGNKANSHMFFATPETGYKFIFGSHVLLELWVGYSFSFGEK